MIVCSIDRVLIATSVVWMSIILAEPALQTDKTIFAGSVLLIAVNGLVALWTLTIRRQVLIALNCTQIVLFGLLNYQLCLAFGPEHYQFDCDPGVGDWIEFTVAHFFRAADVLDALDEYGFDIQNIKHNSTASGIILVCMHVGVDVFLIGLAIRWLSRIWRRPPETILVRGRRRLSRLLVCCMLFLSFAVGQGWPAADWLLWPLDNMLRVLDVGDLFQIFGWRLHDVDMGFWTRTYALFFRLSMGIWLTYVVLWIRLSALHGWGIHLDQLVETLQEGDTSARQGAARALGDDAPGTDQAVKPLMHALHDVDLQVRCEAAAALGRIGARARKAVPELAKALWSEHRPLTLAAAEALGRIGTAEGLENLWWLWKVEDEPVKEAAAQALQQIEPAIFRKRKVPAAVAIGNDRTSEKRYLIF